MYARKMHMKNLCALDPRTPTMARIPADGSSLKQSGGESLIGESLIGESLIVSIALKLHPVW